MDCLGSCLLSYAVTLLALVAGFALWYVSSYCRLRSRRILVDRMTSKTLGSLSSGKLDPDASALLESELLPDTCPGVRSLSDYLNSLKVRDPNVDMEAVVATLVTKLGAKRFLPLLSFLPDKFTSAALPARPLASGLPRITFLNLSAGAEAFSTQVQESSYAVNSLHLMASGGHIVIEKEQARVVVPAWARTLPNPFVLSRDVAASVDAILRERQVAPEDADVRRASPQPDRPIDEEVLPGLHLGSGDLLPTETPRHHAASTLAAALLNRLSTNHCAALHIPVQEHPAAFVVQLTAGGAAVEHPADLLWALAGAGGGAGEAPAVSGQFRVKKTVFGLDLCVKEKGGFAPVAYGIPMATGLLDPRTGAEVHHIATHAGLCLHVRSPLIHFNCQYYQGVEGFTGWHPDSGLEKGWVTENITNAERPVMTGDDLLRAVTLTVPAAIGANHFATANKQVFGGYALLGVCIDSVAVIEAGLTGKTSLFPLVANGMFRMRYLAFMQDMLAMASARQDTQDRIVHSLRLIVRALKTLPNDVQIGPDSYLGTLKRIECNLDLQSPFRIDRSNSVAIQNAITYWESNLI